MSYEHILLALCGKGDEGNVIRQAMDLTKQLNAKITVVHVNELHAGEMSMIMDSPHKFTEAEIRERFVIAGYKDDAKTISINILKSDNIPTAIAGITEKVDLLILGHRKMNSFKEQFFDSVDEGIVNHAKCPVMVVPKD